MKKSCFFEFQIFILQIFLFILRIWSFVTRSRIQHPKSSQRPLKRRGRLQSHYMGTLALRRKDEGLIVASVLFGPKSRFTSNPHTFAVCDEIAVHEQHAP